ncbi:MAG: 2-phospho-L-lactate guanylyltransferase [Actinomycetia bacterium]|nr:2-phospho-L-lactate guanylyltransferase [Actinomycetes bacterium]
MFDHLDGKDVTWHALVPAKVLHHSKTRLGREGLAAAFLADTVSALIESAQVSHVTVITQDLQLATLVSELGAAVIAEPEPADLLGALRVGIESVSNSHGILVALGDLPCLKPTDIDSFLFQAMNYDSSFACDTEGTGSTMWARLPGSPATPHFGTRSRAAHRENGCIELSCSPALHRDVDTETDLWDALRIGVGPATTRALAAQALISATIAGVNPVEAVDESGNIQSYSDFALIGIPNPRIGQRVRIDHENKRIQV